MNELEANRTISHNLLTPISPHYMYLVKYMNFYHKKLTELKFIEL
jgi:hypothetical protein